MVLDCVTNFVIKHGFFSSRVFLLGPSHHYYTLKCALSMASVYKTPVGDLPIDLEGLLIYSSVCSLAKFSRNKIIYYCVV